ncbi:MAG: LPS-assembly protein LptD [Chthoniobacterales bacterium]
MRRLALLFFALSAGSLFAQTAENKSLSGQPMEITATGGTNYDGGLATAHENVAIHIGDTDIYADDATYDPETHDVKVMGNVRIYRATELYVGESGTYNTQTKKIDASNLRTLNAPFYVGGARISSISEDAKLVEKGAFTTSDAQNPDFQIRATTVRIYEGDRVILKNATFYIGHVPVFYWPYLYQSLDDENSFMISPAYTSTWGPSLLGRIAFPITDDINATARLDYRYRRGPALGFSPEINYGKDKKSVVRISTYFVNDYNPTLNRTSLPRDQVDSDRYRLSLRDRTIFGKEWTGFATITKLSDAFILQDFFPGEFRLDPAPDNIIAVNHWNPLYSFTGFARGQVNNFYEVTERLPELAFDVTRHPLFGTGIMYESESSFDYLRRNFPSQSFNNDYDTVRLDSFHQFSYPKTYFGWLSFVPRAGIRATYYGETRDISNVAIVPDPNPLVPDFLIPPPNQDQPLIPGGDHFRVLFNTGAEASFKISRTWEGVQSRALGLDGLRHIIQPFVNYSYVAGNNINPAEILQFDRYLPSTRLRPIDFPQFNSIDTIDNWSIMRVGVRNRLQTRRDDVTINWIENETYLDINFDNPYDKSSTSNLFNTFRFSPVPWAGIGVTAQIPLRSSGFTELNTDIHFQPIAPLSLSFSHRFLSNNPFFADSSLYYVGAYYRINDNWGAGGYARYEQTTNILEEQRYTIYRDLSSWIASVGAIIRDNGGVKEYGVILTFTLKALPKVSLDFNFDPGAPQGSPTTGLP